MNTYLRSKSELTFLIFILGTLMISSCKQEEKSNYQPAEFLPDGPDKAMLHNLYMIEDRQTHTYPFERLKAVGNHASSRIASDRDFQWQPISTKIPGRSRAVCFHKPTETLLTGSVSGGLWKNADYKNDLEWEQIDGFEGSAVNCIIQDPLNEHTLYLGTGESHTAFVNYRESTALGNGIYISENDGETWSLIQSTEGFYYVNDIAIRDENGESIIYVAVGSGTYETRQYIQEGLYRSSNGGGNWTQVLPTIEGGDSNYQVSDIEIASDGTLYISTMRNSENIGGSIVLSSTDGLQWSVINSEFNEENSIGGSYPGASIIKAAPSNPNHLYAVFSAGFYNNLNQLRDYNSYLYQSIDGGANWSEIIKPQIYSLPWHAMAMAVDPNEENKIILGGLDTYVLNNASAGAITELDWIQLSHWFSQYEYNEETNEGDEFYKGKYVHADIHDIQFMDGSSDELLVTTDGGIFHSSDVSVTNLIDPENPIQEFPTFNNSPNGLNTTQYYHAAIHPGKGRNEAIGGTQDNGSLYRNWSTNSEYELSGGDGGFNFFDSSDDNLQITMTYGNRYFIHIDGTTYFNGNYINGLFVNPVVYDDESNLLYSNTATSSYGGLYSSLARRLYDTLQIVNVNKYLETPDLGLDTVSFLRLNAALREAITAMQLSRSSDKTLYFGTENGKVFKVGNIPFRASTERIDNNQLPDGYISSIDVGADERHVVVTYSNFGMKSVWSTTNGGNNWVNLERNLPDMPVRWVRYNPISDNNLIIATEVGIWGLEDIDDESAEWINYSEGFPQIRVDMFDLRESDSTILAATHGQGLYIGKYFQDVNEVPLNVTDELSWQPTFYPNPVNRYLHFPEKLNITHYQIFNLGGAIVKEGVVNNQRSIDLSSVENGLYLINAFTDKDLVVKSQKILKE